MRFSTPTPAPATPTPAPIPAWKAAATEPALTLALIKLFKVASTFKTPLASMLEFETKARAPAWDFPRSIRFQSETSP